MSTPNTQTVEERCQILFTTDGDKHRQCGRAGERERILDFVLRNLTKNPLFPHRMVSSLSFDHLIGFLPSSYHFPKEHDIFLVLDHLWYVRVGVIWIQQPSNFMCESGAVLT